MSKTMQIVGAVTLLFVASCDGSREVDNSKPPKRFQGDTISTRVEFTSDVAGRCAEVGLRDVADTIVNACAIVGTKRREIIIGNPCREYGAYARHLCHEIGHLNGWPADHGK